MRQFVGILVLASLAAPAVLAQRDTASLDVLGVRMLDCSPVSSRPCFRTSLSLGTPVRLPAANTLLKNISIEFDGFVVKPFYVSAIDQAGKSRQGRTAMVLMDISGSMNVRMSNGVSRFEAAKAAVDRFVNDLDPAVDRVAIVPFESHGVIPTIRNARFVNTSEAARQQLAAIPQPKGDTALYAAIGAAIDVLQAQQRRNGGGEYLLVVITDGQNDLGRDPDPELRVRPLTIQAIAAKVSDAHIPVYAIGIGGADDVDILAPLEQIAIENSHVVQEPDELAELLSQARRSLTSRIQVTFQSPYKDAAQLQGRNHSVKVVIGQGPQRAEAEEIWAPQEAMLPPHGWERCDPAEARQLSLFSDPSAPDDYAPVIRPIATFAILGCVLLICWFLLPRLIWPESFAEELPKVDGGARWAAGRQSVRKGPSAVAASAKEERQATDETYVLPRQQLDPKSRSK